MITNHQIKKANEIMKNGITVLVNRHNAKCEFTELDQQLLDELSDLSLTFDFDEEMVDVLCGLQYLYDKDFKGDMDFYPTLETTKKIFGL